MFSVEINILFLPTYYTCPSCEEEANVDRRVLVRSYFFTLPWQPGCFMPVPFLVYQMNVKGENI